MYENIYKEEVKTYSALPVLMREYKNRWYVVAWVESRETYLTFALDRIRELTITGQRQRLRGNFDAENFSRHAVGIFDNDGEPDTVQLQVRAPFHKLVTLDPLHHSQQVLDSTDKSCTIQLSVHITHELHQRILAMGPHCTVLAPESLKKEIRQQLEEALQKY